MTSAMYAALQLLLPSGLQFQSNPTSGASFFMMPLFIMIVFIVIVASMARGLSNRSTIQRPLSGATAFPPPPPPDTVLVKCAYCGTSQTWHETCVQCGAPMPKPHAE